MSSAAWACSWRCWCVGPGQAMNAARACGTGRCSAWSGPERAPLASSRKERASAPTLQLLAQGNQSLLLGTLHRHGADLQPLGGLPERKAFKDGEPERRGLGCRQLIHQLLQRQAIHGFADGRLGFWSSQLIEQAGLAISAGIEAAVAQRALPLLMQPAWHAHQPHLIAQVVLQGALDAAAQIGLDRLACSAAGSGADQGLSGHLDQILPLHQREQAAGGDGGDGIGQGKVLQHQSIAGLEGSAAERLCRLLAAGWGKRGSHLGDGGEPHPHRPAAMPGQGRPTPEGAWPDP